VTQGMMAPWYSPPWDCQKTEGLGFKARGVQVKLLGFASSLTGQILVSPW